MWIRDEWKGGIYFVEHALGGTAGISDCFLILPRQMTPCELKKGEMKKSCFVFELRSKQRDYHQECFDYGIGTIFLVMIGSAVYGCVGKRVIDHTDKAWPMNMWSRMGSDKDIVRLVQAAWLFASKPRLVR
jgi:hypothetical protein